MITLEQVRLLESKVTKTIDYVKKVTEEKTALKGKLDSYQKRIEELEVLIQRFRDDQSRIEDGILSALDRLNQFEDALESKLSTETTVSGESKLPKTGKSSLDAKTIRKKDEAALEPEPPTEEEENPGPAGGELDIF